MTKKCFASLLMAMMCGESLVAQVVERRLSIDDLFMLAEQNSKQIRTRQSAESEARLGVEAAKAQRLPDLKTSLSASYIGNGFTTDLYFKDYASQTLPHFGKDFALQASQAIYTGGALSAGVSLAELGHRMAELTTEQSRQQVRFVLLGHYLNLYKLRNQARVYEQNVRLTERLIANVKAKQEEGTALKNDITRYELQLENLQLGLTSVNNQAGILNFQLCNTLGLPAGTQVLPDTTLLARLFSKDGEAYWQRTATDASPALRQAEVGVQMAAQQERIERSALRPKIALVAEDHLDGPNLMNVPAIKGNFNYWFVGIGLTYDIHSLWKSGRKVKQAHQAVLTAQDSKSEAEEQVQNAVQAAYTQYVQSYVELQTQMKAVELSNQNYDVVSNRYRNDLALVTDMVDAQNQKLAAELQAVNARIGVIYAFYNMQYVSGTL